MSNNFTKKKMKSLAFFLMILMCFQVLSIEAAVEATVDITKQDATVTLSDETERIFDIHYDFSVSYETVTTGLDIVIVLDRSNSMLRIDEETGKPIAQAVWDAVNNFVTNVYNAYPKSNVAIVSFGTNGNKSDNWKYYNNLADTLKEIEVTYAYRDVYTNYSSNYRAFYNNGYRFAWENWQITDGATNIKEAYNYAETTIIHKQVVEEENGEDVILLFTDGVATYGGSNSEKNVNYPMQHNSNTIAGYLAGIQAGSIASVINIGYFEGIEKAETEWVARDTLNRAQNAGLFEASQTNQLDSIFDTVVEKLNYVGTDAKVVEVVEDEFEVIEASIQPSNYSLSTDAMGRTVITWKLGNVTESDYQVGYQIRVKDHVYPTGSGEITIPINLNANLVYEDLNGQIVTESLGQSFTSIPPRDNQPKLLVATTYPNGNQVLIGDNVSVKQTLKFTNEYPYDYKGILMKTLKNTIANKSIGNLFKLSTKALTDGWVETSSAFSLAVNQEVVAPKDVNLVVNKETLFVVKALAEGSFPITYEVSYDLTNSVGLSYSFVNKAASADPILVKNGQIILNLVDNFGVNLTNTKFYLDDLEHEHTVVDGKVVLNKVPSGSHKVTFKLPSGYKLTGTNSGITLGADQTVELSANLSYGAPTFSKTINLERLNVKDIMVTTESGQALATIVALNDKTDAKVSFTLVRPLVQLKLKLDDNYNNGQHDFALKLSGTTPYVTGPNGQVVPGFFMESGKLSYSGLALPTGTYVAHGVLTPPSNLGQALDYDYDVFVNELSTKEATDPSLIVYPITSSELMVAVTDTEAPVITSLLKAEESTTNIAGYEVTVQDKVTIVDVKVYNGTYTLTSLPPTGEALVYTSISDLGNKRILLAEMPLTIVNDSGTLRASGHLTVVAVDAFGNKGIHLIDVVDEPLQSLLDSELR